MATTPSALSSTSTASSGTATFNGTSQYAADLQQAITHAVAVASIPLTELQDNVTLLTAESSELGTLQGDFTGIQTSIQQLNSATGASALTGTVADNTIASVSVDSTSQVLPGTYSLNVISAGSPTSAISTGGSTVTDPSQGSISSSSSFTLTVGTSTYTITPAADTLNSLASAINSANAGVTATIVNLGAPSSPDYRLTLQTSALANETVQLDDGSGPLLSQLAAGAPAQYQVDGQPSTPISSNSATVTLAPGVTADLLQAGQTTVTVAPDSTAAENALSAFATAYNSTLAELNNNHGTGGGVLTGEPVILQLEQSLNELTQYSGGTGSVQSLADLGLTFNDQGQLSFDQTVFENAAATDPTDVANFLGSATGGGFLQNATNVLNGLESTSNGVFTQMQSSYQTQVNTDNNEITDTQNRITTMQNNLTAQMSQADTLIASLESQDSYYTALFKDEQSDAQNQ